MDNPKVLIFKLVVVSYIHCVQYFTVLTMLTMTMLVTYSISMQNVHALKKTEWALMILHVSTDKSIAVWINIHKMHGEQIKTELSQRSSIYIYHRYQ